MDHYRFISKDARADKLSAEWPGGTLWTCKLALIKIRRRTPTAAFFAWVVSVSNHFQF
jgi:hypothetical protein